jgi:hypothetical protein
MDPHPPWSGVQGGSPRDAEGIGISPKAFADTDFHCSNIYLPDVIFIFFVIIL